MRIYRLEQRQTLPINIDEAWEFFSDPNNLRIITPDYLDFKVLHDLPDKMYPGMIIKYQIRPLLGIPVKWTTEITHVREPNYFVDEQRFGPYALWHHKHFFREVKDGVEMEDIVDYGLPLGPFGRVIHFLLIKNKVEQIFSYRRNVLEERFKLQ